MKEKNETNDNTQQAIKIADQISLLTEKAKTATQDLMNVLEESENDVDAEFNPDNALQEADQVSLDLLDSFAENATNAVNDITDKFNDILNGINLHIQPPKVHVNKNNNNNNNNDKDKDKDKQNSYDINVNTDSLKKLFQKKNLRKN